MLKYGNILKMTFEINISQKITKVSLKFLLPKSYIFLFAEKLLQPLLA